MVTGTEVTRTSLINSACVGKMSLPLGCKKENELATLSLRTPYIVIFISKFCYSLASGRTASTAADEPHGCLLIYGFFIHHLPDVGLPIVIFGL